MNIDQVIDGVVAREGGYVNDPRDAGGETNFGITAATARAEGYTGPMRALPRSLAVEIYRRRYVIAPGFDKLAAINGEIAAELVDTGVNMGPKVAISFLQRALNALNRGAKDYADIAADGDAGQATRTALKGFLDVRGPTGAKILLKALDALQGERYISLAEARAANEAFVYGWLSGRLA